MKYKFQKDKTMYINIDGKNYKVNIVYDKRIKKHRRLFAHDHIVLRLPEGTPDHGYMTISTTGNQGCG